MNPILDLSQLFIIVVEDRKKKQIRPSVIAREIAPVMGCAAVSDAVSAAAAPPVRV